ncbi:hypothetical protein K2X30_04310 [bacterium]|jgi:signal transduction histidine kinase|nr:hypothetical protein [bacterium]
MYQTYHLEMDILVQSALLVTLTSFALGFSALTRNVKNKLFLSYAALCGVISIWAATFFLNGIWGGLYPYHLIANVWMAPAALIFIDQLVRIQDRFIKFLKDTSLVLATTLTVAIAFGLFPLEGFQQLIYFSPGLIVLNILRIISLDGWLKKSGHQLPKRREWIYIGALAVLSFSVMDHIPFMGRVIPALGNLGLTVYLVFLSLAVSQQRFLDFSTLISKFIVLVSVALTLTAIYLVLVSWIKDSPPLFFLNSFIASLLILMILDPLERLARLATRKFLTKKHQRFQQKLENAEKRLAGIVDPHSLANAVFDFLDDMIEPDRMAFYAIRSDSTKFRRIDSKGYEESEPKEVLMGQALFQYCERQRKKGHLPIVLLQHLENEAARSATRTQKENYRALIRSLRALGCNLLIPVFDGEQLLGFVTLYVSKLPEVWENSWGILTMLYPYFAEVAEVLRNLDIYVKQREKERLAALGEMAAGLAHEIRNPLGAIKGAAQFLNPAEDRPESDFLRVIIEEVDRLNRVVTQFLDYSKSHALEFTPVDLANLVERTIHFLKPSLRKEVKIDFKKPSTPQFVNGSAERLQQVVLNLIQNSLKATESLEFPKITVSIERANTSDRGEIILSVEDNGPGIKQENLEKIFIPFFTTAPSGTGLGLSICQKIIEAHHGRIEVSSEEGKYARFWVALPTEGDSAAS